MVKNGTKFAGILKIKEVSDIPLIPEKQSAKSRER
jgi:hypothetical protein